ncbi:MAG: DUF1045 domain-containing protein [Patescibacteria group bacterium]
MPKLTNTCFAVSSVIENKTLAQAKTYLRDNFGNIYNQPPHITYSLIPIKGVYLEPLKEEIDRYFLNTNKFDLQLTDLMTDTDKDDEFISIHFADDSAIRKIHADILTITNKYRNGYIRTKDLKRINDGVYTSDKIDNIKKYGYSRVLDDYHPHITIGNITSEGADLEGLEKDIKKQLAEVINSQLVIDNIRAIFYQDAEREAEMKIRWQGSYKLN